MTRYLGARGEAHPRSKLTDAQVLDIRRRRANPSHPEDSATALAREFGIAVSTVAHIVAGRRWGHLPHRRKRCAPGVRLRGQDHPSTAMYDADVLRLYNEYAAGASSLALSMRYGISQRQVVRIVRGENWAHVTGGDCVTRSAWTVRRVKLNAGQVQQIIDRFDADPQLNRSALAREFGITRQQVYYILTGQHWPRITGGINRMRKASHP